MHHFWWAIQPNIGADGNYIELAENALYTGTSTEQGKQTNNNFHTDAKTWDYYEKTIKSDGKYYDVLINVKDTGNEQYVYDITLKEVSLPHRTNLYKRGKLTSSNSIPQNQQNATENQKFSIYGENADDWNVRGKDIALEDIGPVRKDIVQEEKTEWELLEEWLRESQEADKVSDVQQVEKEPTIKQRNKEKLEKYESQLESIKESAERRISKNEELIAKREIERRDLKRSYDAKIAAKREQYEAKKNKDTKAANTLLSQMHNLESRKETRLSECDRDIQYYNSEIAYIREELSDRSQRLQERIEKMNSAEFRTAEQRQMKQEETRTFIQELIGDTSTWKDKKVEQCTIFGGLFNETSFPSYSS